METFTFTNDNSFEIEDYERCKPFASFLPGISGVSGIPMWTFYVNRGQCITGFGMKDKNEPMMEFSPAAIAYKEVYTRGFRTFIKVSDGYTYEAFGDRLPSQTMDVSMSALKLTEERDKIKVSVEYCNVADNPFAGLMRKVTVRNISNDFMELEILDGIPEIIPFGIKNEDYKAMGNLLRSWMDVENLDKEIPYFKLRASTEDEAEVKQIERGHFALSWNQNGQRLSSIVDMENVFGMDTSLKRSEIFEETSLQSMMDKKMVTANKLPGYFSGKSMALKAGESETFYSLFGHTTNISEINQWAKETDLDVFAEQCYVDAQNLVMNLTDEIGTKTANPIFDQYCRQSYLDNLLRGGYPIQLGDDMFQNTFYVYSRKHGDQERDYNFFSISPEYYSQGNGNFRDVNQNRRNDVFFHPEIAEHNIHLFFNLIQLDGYNPLVIEGQKFSIERDRMAEVKKRLNSMNLLDTLGKVVESHFTPGQLLDAIMNAGSTKSFNETDYNWIMARATGEYKAKHGEGFWIDHWTYNLDLIEGYLYVYPDQLEILLLGQPMYRYFDSPYRVLPRKDKIYVSKSRIRQYDAVVLDDEKLNRFNRTEDETHWVRNRFGEGEVVHTTLLAKLISLVATKFALLDPEGMGIEMEAGKPGWNDALNGLPGLFGSSMAEHIELDRLVRFIKNSLDQLPTHEMEMPEEIYGFWTDLIEETRLHLAESTPNLNYWDQARTRLEKYRENIRFGVSGRLKKLNTDAIQEQLKIILAKLERGMDKAVGIGNNLVPTFFKYDITLSVALNQLGERPLRQCIESIEYTALPHFLEGPARQLKSVSEKSGSEIHNRVKKTGIYDQTLGMYKTSASIEEENHEIGRLRAFTPGWLERESVFLHMEYKYLLALLKSRQYHTFFKTVKKALVPFLDPRIYGRPTTENVSFIASSANPDKSQHGRGHIARLSGSTAEFIHMWMIMMAGEEPYFMNEKCLRFKLEPVLPEWLFDDQDEVTFKFGGFTQITYRNPKRLNTFGENHGSVNSMKIIYIDDTVKEHEGSILETQDAIAMRECRIKAIVAEIK